eukprot:TRINITY_DN703_c0_g5_i3.p1 TRINITY_DN703_c0_g5~~TRINITY_DN703_c0_g5_i3.p1  ORF type:complete len:197 (-),score=34.18 TRINITY_DN703_c0_g5_i3:609-1199(-)
MECITPVWFQLSNIRLSHLPPTPPFVAIRCRVCHNQNKSRFIEFDIKDEDTVCAEAPLLQIEISLQEALNGSLCFTFYTQAGGEGGNLELGGFCEVCLFISQFAQLQTGQSHEVISFFVFCGIYGVEIWYLFLQLVFIFVLFVSLFVLYFHLIFFVYISCLWLSHILLQSKFINSHAILVLGDSPQPLVWFNHHTF